MEDVVGFLVDNPVIAILLVFWLFNLLFGKKKKAARDAAAQRANADASGGENPRKTAFAEALSKLEQAIDQADQSSKPLQKVKTTTSKAPLAPRVTRAPAVEESRDPFAFRSLMNSGERSSEGGSYDATTQDYDITGQDYDVTAKDYDQTAVDYDSRTAAFEFRSATKLPADKEYHLKFQGFRTAQRLSSRERIDDKAFDTPKTVASMAVQLLSNADDVRRAFIMQEILGKPKALRPRG